MKAKFILLVLLIGSAHAASAAPVDLKSDWQELSGKIELGYRKALRCEPSLKPVAARNPDQSACRDFASYMGLNYSRIAYLGSNIDQLPAQQLHRVVAASEYEAYQLKLHKIADVSRAWSDQ